MSCWPLCSFAFLCGFALTPFDASGLLSPFEIFSPRERVALRQTANADVFSTPVTVNSCAVGNGERDGEGLVSFARSLVRVIRSMVRVIGGAAIPIVALVGFISSMIFGRRWLLVRHEMAPRTLSTLEFGVHTARQNRERRENGKPRKSEELFVSSHRSAPSPSAFVLSGFRDSNKRQPHFFELMEHQQQLGVRM